MAHRTVHLACLVSLLAVTSATKEQTRWSRQLSTYTSDISDWVPLRGPVEREPELKPSQIKRQAVAEPRILTEPFPGMPRPTGFSADGFRNYFNNPANRQLYLQSVPSVPSAPQNFLTDQGFGQSFRFGLSQPNFPLSQGFVAPSFGFDNIPPPPKPARPQALPMNQVSFTQPSGLPLAVQAKPFLALPPKPKPEVPKFVDGYRAENASNEYTFAPKKKPQSLQKIKFDSAEKVKQEIIPQQSGSHSKSERGEEVQLLYVPLEQLNRGQFNFRSQGTQLMNQDYFAQGLPRPTPPKQNFVNEYQRPALKPLDALPGQNYFADFNAQFKDDQVSKYTTLTTPFATHAPTTPKPKKLKPHQPPLAIFMTKEVSKNAPVKVGDVLSSLKNAETIAVLDSVNPANAPKVFIGPSNLPPPENFVKFELPYLSNIEHGDNKLKQLPFFVAPLSYNTPNGFAKIPFPSPHVGSVVINSQIKETSQTQAPHQTHPSVDPNYYTITSPRPEQKPITQKPTFSYYSTAAPQTKPVPNYQSQSNYYSFEPQQVSTLRPPQIQTQTASPKPGSYFINNKPGQYNSQEFNKYQPQNTFKSSEAIDQYDFPRQPERSTIRTTTTTTTTTRPPSTYPSQLLETHNPYSINQAFHFSTPLDYHNYFDDVKQPAVTPGSVGHSSATPAPAPTSPSTPAPKPETIATEKPKYHQQSSPSYLNNYTPEIHYDSDPNLKYPVFNPNDYVSKTELTSQQTHPSSPVENKYTTNVDNGNKYSTNADTTVNQYSSSEIGVNNYNTDTYNNYNTNVDTPTNSYKTDVASPVNNYNENVNTQNYKTEYNQHVDTTSPVEPTRQSEISNIPTAVENDLPTVYDEHNSYETNVDITEEPSSSTTTSTTTIRTPIRSRGRPRYTTTPRSESYESTPRVVVTRRPLRERRPLPTRSRYEPNKISTEKPGRKPSDSSESTTKSTRTRTRGRIHYKPSDNEDSYDRRKSHNKKEEDLAYQRDVLHQNYPVTLMERMSTVDIEAITEPTPRQAFPKAQDAVTETVDTENAYTNERASISEHEEVKDVTPLPTFTARSTLQAESSYVPNLSSTRNDQYYYQSRSSIAPVEASAYDESINEKEEDIYVKQTTPVPKPERSETIAYATEPIPAQETDPIYSGFAEYATVRPEEKEEEVTTISEVEETKSEIEENQETDEEENVVQTTPSYNRVRVRPGVIRQYHQASSTESSKIKERRKPAQPVTYRPAFDRRRTTMRIDEIEADLKTKQVHVRPEQEYRHPVYKPESTESAASSPTTTESTTKRGHFRRRRPTYTYSTTSTEASSTKRIYEVKNRFRGRRPTEKPTDKPDVQTEAPSSTTRTLLHTRYSHRPRLSERYNKKPEPEVEVEDQDSNFSINRPKYAEPDTDQWSPKISSDSFKPYNPNDIVDEQKIATTERRSDKDVELDIITARNEYEDILLTVTPASNNRMNKKIPEIPATLEAIVEQSKVTKNDSGDSMSTFESMLEEVMKSLEEQDQDEYDTNVMKHKGGEIGEIPPERIISSGDSYGPKSTTQLDEVATEQTIVEDSPLLDEDNHDRNNRRRGFWKKVKVRPVTTESIEFAESQYYTNTVNRLGQPVNNLKAVHEKSDKNDKTKVTTYKPKYQFIKDIFSSGEDEDEEEVIPTMDIRKINAKDTDNEETLVGDESKRTTVYVEKETQTISPGDLDLGTGSPDPTIDDLYFTTPTEPAPFNVDRASGFNFMDFIFGVTSEDNKHDAVEKNATKAEAEIQITTEQPSSKISTTETAFIPEEITGLSEDSTSVPDFSDIKKITSNPTEETKTEKPSEDTTVISVSKVESSSVSSFMNPANVLSTSMSTEISHETEICFRGKCIKTSKDIL